MKVKSLSHVRLLATPWTSAYRAPLSMGFLRQESRSSQITLPSALPGLCTQRRCMWQMSTEHSHSTELLRRQFNLQLNHAYVHTASILSPWKHASQLLESLMLYYFFLNNKCVLSALPTFLEHFILAILSLSKIFA